MPHGRSVKLGVACRGVSVVYDSRDKLHCKDGVPVLEDVTFIARPGRLTGILGHSGSGKTTMTNLINDRVPAKELVAGSCSFFDEEDRSWPSAAEYEKATGHAVRYVMSGHVAPPRLSCRRILETSLALRKSRKVSSDSFVDRVLTLCRLQGAASRQVKPSSRRAGASAGEEKRMAVASEICSADEGELALLILDEPTTSLDTAVALQLICMLRELIQSGMVGSIICTVHQPSPSTFAAFDDIIIVHEGHIVYCGPQKQVLRVMSSISREPFIRDDELSEAEAIFSLLPEGIDETRVMSRDFYATEVGVECVDEAYRERTNEDKPAAPRESWLARAVWEIYVLMRMLSKYYASSRLTYIGMPLLFMAQGLILGGLFRGSFVNIPPAKYDYIPMTLLDLPDYKFVEAVAYADNTVIDDWFANKTDGKGGEDALATLLSKPFTWKWAHRFLHCAHNHLGLSSRMKGTNTQANPHNYTYPENYFLTVPQNPGFKNNFSVDYFGLEDTHLGEAEKNLADLPAEETFAWPRSLSSSDLTDADILFDDSLSFITPKLATTGVLTVLQLLHFLVELDNYQDWYWIWNAAPKSSSLFYLQLLPLLPKIDFALRCTGLPPISSDKDSELSAENANMREHLETLLERWTGELAELDLPGAEGGAPQPEREAESKGREESPETLSNASVERRKLFLIYDETWPLFTVLRNMFEGLGMPGVYHELRFAVQALTNGMSIGAACFFLGCLIGFSCLEIPFNWDAFRLQTNRNVMNRHHARHAFFWAFNLATIPYNVVTGIAIALPFVYMTGLPRECHLGVILVSVLLVWSFAGLGIFLSALSSTLAGSMRCIPLALVYMVLFSSFFVRDGDIPRGMRHWLDYSSPYRWGINAFILFVFPAGSYHGMLPGEVIKGVNGVLPSSPGICAAYVIALGCFYRLLGFFSYLFLHTKAGCR